MASLFSILVFEPLDVVLSGKDCVRVVGKAGRPEDPLEVAVVDIGPLLALVLAEGDGAEKYWVLRDFDKVTNRAVLEKNLEDLACDVAVIECAVRKQAWRSVNLEVEPIAQNLVGVAGSVGKNRERALVGANPGKEQVALGDAIDECLVELGVVSAKGKEIIINDTKTRKNCHHKETDRLWIIDRFEVVLLTNAVKFIILFLLLSLNHRPNTSA